MNEISIEECKVYIQNWKDVIQNPESDPSFFEPNFCFNFTQPVYDKLIKENEYENFHVYMGLNVVNDIVAMLFPLDSLGNEKLDLDNYILLNYEDLGTELILNQKIRLGSYDRITIGSSVEHNSISTHQDPEFTKPMISVSSALSSLTNWELDYKNWFNKEIAKGVGSQIFKAFSVQMEDLIDDSYSNYVEVKALFVLESKANNLMANLIFVSNIDLANYSSDKLMISNIFDFAVSCPPYCVDKKKKTSKQIFKLL